MSGTDENNNKDENNNNGGGGGQDDPNKVPPPSNPNPGGDGGAGDDDDSDDFDYSNADAVKKEIKKLRKEAASKRVSNKELTQKVAKYEETQKKLKQVFGLEDDEVDPAEQVQQLQAENQMLKLDMELNQIAGDLEIPQGNQKYFKFLVKEKLQQLDEGEELSDEDLEAIAQEVRALGGNKQTSTGLKKPQTPPPSGDGNGAMTVEGFMKLSLSEKSLLYTKDPAEYDRLFRAAKDKGLI